MATIQCKMCGGSLDLPPDISYAECPYCGSATTFPKIEDSRKEILYNRAEKLRRDNDFDKALQAYEKILEIDESDPEIYWGMTLCRYGIEYVEDPVSHERIPTCHRMQFESILQDTDYQSALERAAGNESAYEHEAQKIAEIQKGILRISSQEEPFDVFICYKETTDAGTRTKDSIVAQDIYYQLTNEGYRVFFARITLEDKLGQQYEPYIFAALNSAKVMLVIGSKKEYFEAVWVKNEWSRFLSILKKDRSKLLIPCYKDIDAYDIPEELAMLQSQDMSKIGFMQDLLRGIKKVLAKTDGAGSSGDLNKSGSSNSVEAKIAQLLKRAQVEKELDNPEAVRKIGEEITNLDIDNAEGWYLQACNLNNFDRARKIFEKIIKMKPGCAEYYIAAARELFLFDNSQKNIKKLINAHAAWQDNGEDVNDKSFALLEQCFDTCCDDTDNLEFCINSLSNVIDNKIVGVNFSESDKEEAKSEILPILETMINVMETLSSFNLYSLFLEKHDAKEEINKLGRLILMRTQYTNGEITEELFFNAVAAGNLSVIEKYIDDGGIVNILSDTGDTPLIHAVRNGQNHILKYLIERGANVNTVNDLNQTALHVACAMPFDDCNTEIVKELLRNGAEPNTYDDAGNSPLSEAFAQEEISIPPEILNQLCEAGADPNHTVGWYTPLIQAAKNPKLHELLLVLLENGANYMLTSGSCGGTPMDYARGGANIDLLKQVECPRALNFNPIEYDNNLREQQRLSNLKEDSPFQIKEFTIGSYLYSEIDGVIRPLGFMSDDDKANCPLGASMKVQNTSNQIIKYIHIELQPINDVNDFMADSKVFTFTGPLNPGQTQSFRIENMNFRHVDCSNINDLVVIAAEIEFMNGDSKIVSGEAILLEKASISGAQIANGILEVGKLAKGIFDIFS